MPDRLGKGLRFPPGIDADGRWAWSSGVDNVRESIRVILTTNPRERVMLPGFGGGLERFLQQPNVTATHRLIEEAITQTLGRWEPRVALEAVTVRADADDPLAARADLRYRVIATGIVEESQVVVSLG